MHVRDGVSFECEELHTNLVMAVTKMSIVVMTVTKLSILVRVLEPYRRLAATTGDSAMHD
jgi:hypothetical protein